MHYLSVISILLVVSFELGSGFHNFDINWLLDELDLSQVNLKNVEEKWIDQPVDHFNPSETRTFNMRYFENLEVWQPNGPIYIFIGGEGETLPNVVLSHDTILMAQMARKTNGALYATEHRYYGKSTLDPTLGYQFLNSQQALADLVTFIKMLKSKPDFTRSKVVVVSGSYPGNLVAWLRELHPDLVDAAIAGSAPVLAKKDFHEYLDVIRYALGTYGSADCLKNIEKRYTRYEELLKSREGMNTLSQELNICPGNDLTVLENQQYLFYQLYLYWMIGVQRAAGPSDIQELCKSNANNFKIFKAEVKTDRNVSCMNVDFWSHITSDPWTYQYCNEFGYLMTTSSEKQPFVHWNPLQFTLKSCTNVIHGDIEKTLDEGIARTNKMYGGRSPNVNKVVFTHGDMDPWSSLGVLQDLGPDASVTIVNGSSHCGILFVRQGEPEELNQNREYVKSLIYKWISTA